MTIPKSTGEAYENTLRIDRTEKALRMATDLGDDEAHPAEDKATALADMIGNLMHWARLHVVDFDAALERGREYFTEETEMEAEELK